MAWGKGYGSKLGDYCSNDGKSYCFCLTGNASSFVPKFKLEEQALLKINVLNSSGNGYFKAEVSASKDNIVFKPGQIFMWVLKGDVGCFENPNTGNERALKIQGNIASGNLYYNVFYGGQTASSWKKSDVWGKITSTKEDPITKCPLKGSYSVAGYDSAKKQFTEQTDVSLEPVTFDKPGTYTFCAGINKNSNPEDCLVRPSVDGDAWGKVTVNVDSAGRIVESTTNIFFHKLVTAEGQNFNVIALNQGLQNVEWNLQDLKPFKISIASINTNKDLFLATGLTCDQVKALLPQKAFLEEEKPKGNVLYFSEAGTNAARAVKSAWNWISNKTSKVFTVSSDFLGEFFTELSGINGAQEAYGGPKSANAKDSIAVDGSTAPISANRFGVGDYSAKENYKGDITTQAVRELFLNENRNVVTGKFYFVPKELLSGEIYWPVESINGMPVSAMDGKDIAFNACQFYDSGTKVVSTRADIYFGQPPCATIQECLAKMGKKFAKEIFTGEQCKVTCGENEQLDSENCFCIKAELLQNESQTAGNADQNPQQNSQTQPSGTGQTPQSASLEISQYNATVKERNVEITWKTTIMSSCKLYKKNNDNFETLHDSSELATEFKISLNNFAPGKYTYKIDCLAESKTASQTGTFEIAQTNQTSGTQTGQTSGSQSGQNTSAIIPPATPTTPQTQQPQQSSSETKFKMLFVYISKESSISSETFQNLERLKQKYLTALDVDPYKLCRENFETPAAIFCSVPEQMISSIGTSTLDHMGFEKTLTQCIQQKFPSFFSGKLSYKSGEIIALTSDNLNLGGIMGLSLLKQTDLSGGCYEEGPSIIILNRPEIELGQNMMRIIMAHEMGHSIGCLLTEGPDGSIMAGNAKDSGDSYTAEHRQKILSNLHDAGICKSVS